jgi:hypothetical protein
MGIGQVFISSQRKRNLNCPIVALAVEHDSPVFPIEGGIDIDLIEVVLLGD